jgi:hypothetical protein
MRGGYSANPLPFALPKETLAGANRNVPRFQLLSIDGMSYGGNTVAFSYLWCP